MWRFTAIVSRKLFAFIALWLLGRCIHEATLPKFDVHVQTEGIVLITGTSTGIGRAASLYLAEKYPRITFFCGVRRAEDGERLQNSAAAGNLQPIVLDVTRENDVRNAIETIEGSGKPLIGLINNAGVMTQPSKTIEFLSYEDFRFHFDVNVFGVFRLTQAALPLLRRSRGRVLLMSSIYGRTAIARIAGYAATKHAIEAFGDALRREVAPVGVSVSVVEPGFLPSEITASALRAERAHHACRGESGTECRIYHHLYNEQRLKFAEEVIGRMGEMDETVAALDHALFAPRPRTRYATSVVGPLPAWLFLRIMDWLPDHLADML